MRSPYAALLGLQFDSDSPDEIVMPWNDAIVGRPGFVHGGALAGLLEAAALAEARRHLGGRAAKPVGINVDYLRGGRAVETRAAATVVRLGRTVVNLAATAWQDDRARPIAAARLTLLIDQ